MSRLLDLYALIQRLTPIEVRFVRRFFSGTESTQPHQQVDLFELLVNTSFEDEESIIRALPSSNHHRNLPTLVQRLRKAVYASLSAYRVDENIVNRLHNYLAALHLLFQKNLPDQMSWTLKKSRRWATKFDKKHILLQLIQWERRMVHRQRPPNLRIRLDDLQEEEQNVFESLGRELRLQYWEDELTFLMQRSHHIGAGAHDEVLAKLKSEELQRSYGASDQRSRMLARSISANAFTILGKYSNALREFEWLLEEWQKDPTWIDEYPDQYLRDYNRFQVVLLRETSDISVIEQHLRGLRNLPLSLPTLRLRFQGHAYQQQLLIYLNLLNWEAGEQLIEEVEDWIFHLENELSIGQQIAFRYNFAVFSFLQEKFEQTNRHLNQIYQIANKTERVDIRSFARLLGLIVNLERDEFDLNDSQLRATQVWFQRQNLDSSLSQAVFKLIRSSLKLRSRQLPEAFRILWEDLEAMKGAPFLLELHLWAESRARGISLPEIAQLRISQMQSPDASQEKDEEEP